MSKTIKVQQAHKELLFLGTVEGSARSTSSADPSFDMKTREGLPLYEGDGEAEECEGSEAECVVMIKLKKGALKKLAYRATNLFLSAMKQGHACVCVSWILL